jgi:hypothetical protein
MRVGREWTLAAAALALSGLTGPATAGQRSATLSVSVQVVEACATATDGTGVAEQACSGPTRPIAIEGHSTEPADAQPVVDAPIARTAEQRIITIIY